MRPWPGPGVSPARSRRCRPTRRPRRRSRRGCATCRPAGAAAGRRHGAVRPRRGRAPLQRGADRPAGRAATARRHARTAIASTPSRLGPQGRARGADARGRRRRRDRSDRHHVVHRDHDSVARRLPGRRPGLRPDVRRLPITALGCAAGAAALARAHDFLVGFPDARVLVIAVELPSLSLQRADLSLANLVATALFGDGAAAAVLTGGEAARRTGTVAILETLSHICAALDLRARVRSEGRRVPLACCRRTSRPCSRSRSRRWCARWPARRGSSREQLSSFVLHPGGRKILGFVEEELGLIARRHAAVVGRAARLRQPVQRVGAVRAARVADAAACRRRAAHGVLAAFGPGLTSEMLLLGWN